MSNKLKEHKEFRDEYANVLLKGVGSLLKLEEVFINLVKEKKVINGAGVNSDGLYTIYFTDSKDKVYVPQHELIQTEIRDAITDFMCHKPYNDYIKELINGRWFDINELNDIKTVINKRIETITTYELNKKKKRDSAIEVTLISGMCICKCTELKHLKYSDNTSEDVCTKCGFTVGEEF